MAKLLHSLETFVEILTHELEAKTRVRAGTHEVEGKQEVEEE